MARTVLSVSIATVLALGTAMAANAQPTVLTNPQLDAVTAGVATPQLPPPPSLPSYDAVRAGIQQLSADVLGRASLTTLHMDLSNIQTHLTALVVVR